MSFQELAVIVNRLIFSFVPNPNKKANNDSDNDNKASHDNNIYNTKPKFNNFAPNYYCIYSNTHNKRPI